MKVIGIRCTKDQLHWVVLEGATRADAVVLEHQEPKAPAGDRAEQLGWARKELLEMLTRHTPVQVCLRVAEGGQNVAASLQRAEMDGVVQATVSERGIPVWRLYSATIRSAFSARKKVDLEAATAAVPCVATSVKVRREQVVVAVAAFPA
jgi:hypothetical protein